MKNIGREVGHDNLVEFSKKLNLEEQLQTSTAFSKTTINYEEWEDIFMYHRIYIKFKTQE